MQIHLIKYRILKDNSYLLIISVLMLLLSLFTGKSVDTNSEKRYASVLEAYIKSSEDHFQKFYSDTTLIHQLVAGTQTEVQTEKLAAAAPYYFVYQYAEGLNRLCFWNTQAVLPPLKLCP